MKKMIIQRFVYNSKFYPLGLLLIVSTIILHCTEEVYQKVSLPQNLPFELMRPDVGDPVSQTAIESFTRELTSAWKKADIFNYLHFVSYGVEKDNPAGEPYYSNFWTGVKIIKEGDRITFYHRPDGSSDNATQRQMGLLASALTGFQLTGETDMVLFADELARGIKANMMCLEWDENVPERDKYLMARHIIPNPYETTYETTNGKTITYAVDTTEWQRITSSIRHDTIHVPNNPYWGDIWVQNKRSKDDVCHIYRSAFFLPYMINQLPFDFANESIKSTFDYLKYFAQDIVNHNWSIRTRDHEGNIINPAYLTEGNFASFVEFGEEAECTAMLSTALLGYEETMGMDCGNGIVEWYEEIATSINHFNYKIIANFHVSAILLSLLYEQNDLAYNMLQGLMERADKDYNREFDTPDLTERFKGEHAGYLVRYATCGLPLTSQEVAFIHEQFSSTIDIWMDYEYWDITSDSLSDGEYPPDYGDYYPSSRPDLVNMLSFLQLCYSPFQNENGQQVVDCNIIRDMDNWGM